MQKRWSRELGCLTALAIALMACSETDTTFPAQAEQGQNLSEGRFAVLSLNAPTGHSPRFTNEIEVTGQFVQFTGPSEQWALNALDLWLPTEERLTWEDTCELRLDVTSAGPDATGPLGSSALPAHRVELLDAGNLHLDGAIELPGRYVPDLLVYMNGMVYRLDPGHGFLYQPGSEYHLEGSGLDDHIGAFDVTAIAPHPMVLTALNGEIFGHSIQATLPDDGSLSVEWFAFQPEDGQVFLDVYSDAHATTPLLSCTVADDGYFEMPRDALRTLARDFPGSDLRLVARRAQLTPFDLDGVDWASAIFVTSDVATLSP